MTRPFKATAIGSSVRTWVKVQQGLANSCGNPACKHTSRSFGWVCIVQPWLGYTRELSHYIQLCRSCQKSLQWLLVNRYEKVPDWLQYRVRIALGREPAVMAGATHGKPCELRSRKLILGINIGIVEPALAMPAVQAIAPVAPVPVTQAMAFDILERCLAPARVLKPECEE